MEIVFCRSFWPRGDCVFLSFESFAWLLQIGYFQLHKFIRSAPHVGHQYGPNMTMCHIVSMLRCSPNSVTCNSSRYSLTSRPAIHILMSPFDSILFNFPSSMKYYRLCRAIFLCCLFEMWGPFRYPYVRYSINNLLQSLLSCDCAVMFPQTMLRGLF